LVSVPVVGVGDGPNISVPGSFDFGDVAGYTTRVGQLQIDNVGTQTLSVTDIVSDDPTIFSVLGPTTASIPPGGFELIDIEFTPQAFGSYAATLTITSDDPAQPTIDLPLTGGPVAMFLNPVDAGTGDGGGLSGLRVFYLLGDGSVIPATTAAGNLPLFESSDPSVVSPLPSGNLVVNGQGEATITASVLALTAQTTATVGAPSAILNIAYFPSNLLSLVEGEVKQIAVFAIDAGTLNHNDNVSVVSDNGSVLSVDSVTPTGDQVRAEIRGVSAGQANLTFTSLDDPTVFQTVEVHVVGLDSVVITPAAVTFPVSGVRPLVAASSGSDGTHSFAFSTDVDWSSDAPAIAPVFPNGNVVGLSVGSAQITAESTTNPGIQGTADVIVTAATDLPEAALSGLAGEDIVASGIDMGTAAYATAHGNIVVGPRVEKVFVVENQATGSAPLEVVFADTDTDRLEATATSGPIAPGRIGALEVLVTIPASALGGPDPGPTSGTLTVYTNQPSNHQIDIDVSWTWQEDSGADADASTTMFIDFGDIPQGQSRDRTYQFQVFKQGGNSGKVTDVTASSVFSLRTPNPNPFMVEGFPVVQGNEEIPLTFTIRSTPNASTGRFQGVVSFHSDDVDEPVIETLVVAYGAPTEVPILSEDLAYATGGAAWLKTVEGSELVLTPVPAGGDGLEFDGSVAYMYSTAASAADPAAGAFEDDAYLFKVTPGLKPEVISTNLSAEPAGLAVDFAQNLSYLIDLEDPNSDLVKVTDSGQASVVVTDGFTASSSLGIDSSGDLYASRVIQSDVAITKYSSSGTQLARFDGTSQVRRFELAADVLYTDQGTEFDTSGVETGTFTVVPDSLWFTVDSLGNILFGDGSGGWWDPQLLTLEDPQGGLQPAGELPSRASQADF
jgi:hypothetical protein